MSSSKTNASALPFLPQEIIVQILSKLPAKSLFRFKCVSKFFCSLVVDHRFLDRHRNWSLTCPRKMSILIFFPLARDSTVNLYYTINYSEENQGMLQANRLLYIDYDPNLYRKVYVSSSVDGLICFCNYSKLGDDIAIHNLSTQQHISLPSSYPRFHSDSGNYMNAFGLLGFDSDSRRYKVLKSVHITDPHDQHVSVKHWVFTLGVDKSWREIHSSPSYHPYNCFNNHSYFYTSVHINGVIYSVNSLNRDNSLNKDYSWSHIVAFDLRAEIFHEISLLPSTTITMVPRLVELDGRLAIVDLHVYGLHYNMAIWILEESMVVWKKQYLIRIPIPFEESKSEWVNKGNFFFATNHVGEIAVLVMLSRSVSILFYNFRRQSWRKFDICQLPVRQNVPLPWSTAMHFILDNVFQFS